MVRRKLMPVKFQGSGFTWEEAQLDFITYINKTNNIKYVEMNKYNNLYELTIVNSNKKLRKYFVCTRTIGLDLPCRPSLKIIETWINVY